MPDSTQWKPLYKAAAYASLLMLFMIPIQIIVFALWPPPETIEGFFELFHKNWFLGLLSLDLLYIVNSIVIILIYLALYVLLRKGKESLMLIAISFGFIGLAMYFPSNPAFEMWHLSSQYYRATEIAQKALYLSAGHGMLATYVGTAFNVYYVLNAITLLLFSIVMLKNPLFSKKTAYMGLISGIFMTIPSTVGTIGLIFSLLSLVPWVVFTYLIMKRFFQLSH